MTEINVVLEDEPKSCLLRAARHRFRKLQAQLYRHKELNARHMQGVIEATEAEIDCLAKGITWLWNYRPGPPGPHI